MSDHTEARSDDPKWLIDRLRTEAGAADTDAELPDAPTPDEVWADKVLTDANVEYPAALEAATDALIAPVAVSPQARQRFIAAAERALAVRRADLGPLPVVLAAARKRANLTLEQVQAMFDDADVDIDASELETGRVTIHEAGVQVVAVWVHATRAERGKARDGASRSIETDLGGELRPAAGSKAVRREVATWLADFDEALDRIEAGDQ